MARGAAGQRVVWWLVAVIGIAACRDTERATPLAQEASAEAPWRQPGDVIDSILPMDTMLARFRMGTTAPAALVGGVSSSSVLAQVVVTALAARDTAALAGLLVTREEYAWLLFPHHVYANPPYELDPALAWFRLSSASSSGLSRLLRDYGGKAITMTGVSCAPDTMAVVSGAPLRIWGPCQLSWREADGAERSGRLFGSILERDGRMKLLSYKSDL